MHQTIIFKGDSPTFEKTFFLEMQIFSKAKHPWHVTSNDVGLQF